MTTKSDIVTTVANAGYTTKSNTEAVVNETLKAITEALANGNDVQLAGFGKFGLCTFGKCC